MLLSFYPKAQNMNTIHKNIPYYSAFPRKIPHNPIDFVDIFTAKKGSRFPALSFFVPAIRLTAGFLFYRE